MTSELNVVTQLHSHHASVRLSRSSTGLHQNLFLSSFTNNHELSAKQVLYIQFAQWILIPTCEGDTLVRICLLYSVRLDLPEYSCILVDHLVLYHRGMCTFYCNAEIINPCGSLQSQPGSRHVLIPIKTTSV